jgi:hypothetical protein
VIDLPLGSGYVGTLAVESTHPCPLSCRPEPPSRPR